MTTKATARSQGIWQFTTWRSADQIEFEQQHGLRDRLSWKVCEHDADTMTVGDHATVIAGCGSVFIGRIDEVDDDTVYVVLR